MKTVAQANAALETAKRELRQARIMEFAAKFDKAFYAPKRSARLLEEFKTTPNYSADAVDKTWQEYRIYGTLALTFDEAFILERLYKAEIFGEVG